MVPIVEPTALVSEEGVGLIVDGLLLGESMSPEKKRDIPLCQPQITTLIAATDEPSVLFVNSPVELPSLHLVLPLHKVAIDQVSPLLYNLLDLITS